MAADKLHRDASELLEKLGRWADAFRELPNHGMSAGGFLHRSSPSFCRPGGFMSCICICIFK